VVFWGGADWGGVIVVGAGKCMMELMLGSKWGLSISNRCCDSCCVFGTSGLEHVEVGEAEAEEGGWKVQNFV
jgi:hypothetical protein